MRALIGHLDESEDALGVHVNISHEAPTPPGTLITVTVEMTAVDGRQLTFAVQAQDDTAVISRGTHRRAVIPTQRFQTRLLNRTARPRSPS